MAVTLAAKVAFSKCSATSLAISVTSLDSPSWLNDAFAARPCAAITGLLPEHQEIADFLRMSYSQGLLYRLCIGCSRYSFCNDIKTDVGLNMTISELLDFPEMNETSFDDEQNSSQPIELPLCCNSCEKSLLFLGILPIP